MTVKLFHAISHVGDVFIDEAAAQKRKTAPGFWKRAGIAAAFALVLGASALFLANYRHFFGGNMAGGGRNTAEGSVFMSYAGPIFPLSLAEHNENIAALREISFDFSVDYNHADPSRRRFWGADMEDKYILHNTGGKTEKITAVYPFAGSLDELEKWMPAMAVHGQTVETTLHFGGYAGGFTGFFGGDDPNGSGNLQPIQSFEEYQVLLADGGYEAEAFAPPPVLNQSVTVYPFTEFAIPEGHSSASQGISFSVDPEKTTVLSFGFNGIAHTGNNRRTYTYHVPHRSSTGQTVMLVVLGDDIGTYTLQGYQTGAIEEKNALDGVSAVITRSEAVLSDVMAALLAIYFPETEAESGLVSPEMLLDATAEYLLAYSLLSASPRERYQDGRLEGIFREARMGKRVLYVTFAVEIPAGETVSITASFYKAPSFDFYGSKKANHLYTHGYDMATQLGSRLAFAKQTAKLKSAEGLVIVRQNFGFDTKAGVLQVELDPSIPRYYMEIHAANP